MRPPDHSPPPSPSPFLADTLALVLPRATLNALARDHNAPPITSLDCPGGQVDRDAYRLAVCLLPALSGMHPTGSGGAEGEDDPLFAHHVVLALRSHVAQRYGGLRRVQRRRGGLGMRQERQAKELLLTSLQDGSSLADIASAVGLSRGHFLRAFRQSVGETPHRWLTARKLEQAMRLMRETDMPLAEVALACGFSDQPHLTRTFARHMGEPPGAWRRNA